MTTNSACVYVVDDDTSVLRALRRLLKANGLPVQTFSSAKEFLESYTDDLIGCLVLDQSMPGMTGLDLQKKLIGLGSELPVIFITAFEDEIARKQALTNGAVAWFMKPVSEEDLLKAIASVI